jgi:hypothetical protein
LRLGGPAEERETREHRDQELGACAHGARSFL